MRLSDINETVLATLPPEVQVAIIEASTSTDVNEVVAIAVVAVFCVFIITPIN